MKYLKEYNENIDIHDLENCLQEIFDEFDIRYSPNDIINEKILSSNNLYYCKVNSDIMRIDYHRFVGPRISIGVADNKLKLDKLIQVNKNIHLIQNKIESRLNKKIETMFVRSYLFLNIVITDSLRLVEAKSQNETY